ncbi:BRO-N domain-containing protein [Azospirillum aestuarii]|uniref:BRO-N domain-containing protein n=1 Tax=Azospirillum aestuarii TaxID=2802052 RepID=UPI004054F217
MTDIMPMQTAAVVAAHPSPWLSFAFEGVAVRIVDHVGDPRFVLADVCRVLEIGNPSDAARRLDDDEKDALDIIDPMGRTQNATAINESGLYSLILTSRKPAAKRFKKWVTAEVLPAIRRTGSYGAPIDIAATVATHLQPIQEQIADLTASVRDLMLSANGKVAAVEYVSVRQILDEAKAVQRGRNGINRKIGRELRDLACQQHPPVAVRKCPHTGVWLYPVDFVSRYMLMRGNALVAEHNADAAGGTLTLPLGPGHRRRKG